MMGRELGERCLFPSPPLAYATFIHLVNWQLHDACLLDYPERDWQLAVY